MKKFTETKLWYYLLRWQEFLGWAPLVAVLAVVAWVTLGALDPVAAASALSTLVDLPARAVAAILAVGIAYLAWRRWSYRLDEEQRRRLWDGVMAGDRGPIIVYLFNGVFFLCAAISLLVFFS